MTLAHYPVISIRATLQTDIIGACAPAGPGDAPVILLKALREYEFTMLVVGFDGGVGLSIFFQVNCFRVLGPI